MIINSSKFGHQGFNSDRNVKMEKLFQKKSINLSAIIVLMFSLQSCDPAKKDWDVAVKEDNIDAYSLFLKKNPKSKYKDYASQKIDSLLCNKAVISLKINNPKFQRFSPNKINSVAGQLNPKEMQDLINILVEKSNSPKASLKFIAPISLPNGKDLTGKLHPLLDNTIEVTGSRSSTSESGEKIICTISGILDGGNLNNSLEICKGSFLGNNTPDKINYKGSFTITSNGKHFLYSTYYPIDELYFTFHFFNYEMPSRFMLPLGKNSVIRITGQLNNYFNGIAIKSDNTFPLHLIVKEKGLYYLMGKGEIKVNNGKPLVFM